MKTFILLIAFTLFLAVQARRIQRAHGISLDDIANLPVDALQPALSGDFNSVAQKYAMSKVGLSNSKTVGSYFGRSQPQTPLSGLSSFFGGSANSGTNTNQGGLSSLLGGGQQGTQNGANQNLNGQGQGGFSDLLSKFTGGNNGNTGNHVQPNLQNQHPQN